MQHTGVKLIIIFDNYTLIDLITPGVTSLTHNTLSESSSV